MLNIFVGVDSRAMCQYMVTHYSILKHASVPVSITPLIIDQLPINRRGLTEFTFSRWLVPYLMNYKGWGLFVDSDFIFDDDIAKLFAEKDDRFDLMVADKQGELGYERAAIMLFNCAKCKNLTPDFIETQNPFSFNWAENIGHITQEWNYLVGYEPKNDKAKGIHYTMGVPIYKDKVKGCDRYSDWWKMAKQMNTNIATWDELMGQSKHAKINSEGERMSKLAV